MRFRATMGLMAVACVCGLSGAATAEPQAPASPTPPSSTAMPELDLSAVEKNPAILTEMADHGRVAVMGVARIRGAVEAHLRDAREKHDSVKMNCVNDALNRIDALRTNITARNDALQRDSRAAVGPTGAVLKENADQAYHDYQMVAEYDRQGIQILAQANACIGSELSFTGAGSTQVFAPDVPPPTDLPGDFGNGDLGGNVSQACLEDPALCAWVAPPICVSCNH